MISIMKSSKNSNLPIAFHVLRAYLQRFRLKRRERVGAAFNHALITRKRVAF